MKESFGVLLFKVTDFGTIQVLLVKSKSNKTWGIPKGKPNQKETPEQTAVRETREECGINPNDIKYLGKVKTKTKQITCFYSKMMLEEKPACFSDEIEEVEFMYLNEAFEIICPEQRKFIELLIRELQKLNYLAE